jgi:putative endonuclease
VAESCLPAGRGLRKTIFYVYILKSLKDNKIYIGKTNNIKRRLDEHNNGQVSSTKSRRPFTILETINCETEKDALHLEKEFKKGYKREEIKRKFNL